MALDGRITECNRAFLVMLGLTLEEARQLTYQDLTPERWHAQEAKIIAEQVRVRGYSDIYEKEYRRKDGTIFPIELQTYLTLDEHDQPNGMWAFMRDISDRKRTEMALNESAQKYQALVEATDTGVVILGPGAKVLDANPAYVRLTGRERLDEILGRSVMEWTAPPQRELSADGIRRCLEDESPFTVELDYVSPRGRLTPIELNATVARSEGGDQVLALCRDITERKRAEAERERLIAEANAANSAKDQFLAVLSHELRNPLAAIHAGIELLRRTAAADNPQVMRVLEIVERNARLQARLVGDLLDLSRIARGKITLQPTVVKLDDLVLSAVHACQADAERASVHLEFRTDVALWVYADSDRLQQVVVNLVQNGVKFTPAGGRVIVTVARAESRVRIVVEDTGIGIEASRLPQLFQMFQQGQVGARRAPGLGIGLALVRSLTEMQHGKVWAESPGPGLGSRFTVELHLTDSPETRSTCEASEPARRAAKLLLVEDNPDTLVVMAEALAALGYEVVPAASGEEALDLLAARPVDAVIADIELPGIDGYEFLRRARRLPGTAGVPAFAATGYGQQSDAQRALEAGFTAHLVKPVDLKILDQRVRSALAGSARSRPVSGSGKAEGEPRELPVEVGDELRAVHRP